jgi:hypothetical protein
MGDMKSVTVREVCRQFSRKVEVPLRRGETLILRKQKGVVGHVVPDLSRGKPYPDFAAPQKNLREAAHSFHHRRDPSKGAKPLLNPLGDTRFLAPLYRRAMSPYRASTRGSL